jgi:hypothetical protein
MLLVNTAHKDADWEQISQGREELVQPVMQFSDRTWASKEIINRATIS